MSGCLVCIKFDDAILEAVHHNSTIAESSMCIVLFIEFHFNDAQRVAL